MLISDYYNLEGNKISFSRDQGSQFAKEVANDFNPLHDVDAKRFCVPGDLLFAVVLSLYGCSQKMQFNFEGMVTEETLLDIPPETDQMALQDSAGKTYLTVNVEGDKSLDAHLIRNLVQQYVAFSGQTFPHILVPLMKDKGVMINPSRPMVMYQSMMIDLQQLDTSDINLVFDKQRTQFEVNGKRGNICLAFKLMTGEALVGRGEKHMVVGGLKPFEQEAIDAVIQDYDQWKKNYF